MKEVSKMSNLQLNREKALYLYVNALERGDFDTVGEVLAQAENDKVLGQMLIDLNEEYRKSEQASGFQPDDAGLVQRLLKQFVQTDSDDKADEVESNLTPLSVRNVLDKMRSDAAIRGQALFEVEKKLGRILADKGGTELPRDLSKQSITRFFQDLKVDVDIFSQKAFRDAALLLAIGRETHQAQLAAARRQTTRKPGKPKR